MQHAASPQCEALPSLLPALHGEAGGRGAWTGRSIGGWAGATDVHQLPSRGW